jgi:hypothetical protein
MLDTQKIKNEVHSLSLDTRKWHSKREFYNLNLEEFTNEMKIKYEYLYTNSSTLFERSMKGDLNIQQLTFMLQMIEKVNAGADYQTTSTEVGQRLVDIYVKPLIEKKDK